jgi:hypothetical protein
MLTLLELNAVPQDSEFGRWVKEWRWLIVVIALSMIFVPPIVARGFQHLRTREGYARRRVAESFALESIQSRAKNLIAKIHEVEDGKITKEYLAHTMTSCHTYFRGRTFSGTEEVDGRTARIDVAYYARIESPVMFRKVKTNDGSTARFIVSATTRSHPQGKEIIASLDKKNGLSPADFVQWAPAFLEQGHGYMSGLGVPVLSSGKDHGRTIGLILAISDDPDALHETDRAYLTVQAWMLSSAASIENMRRTGTSE